MKDIRGSITQDSNPEGINQYTGGTSALAESHAREAIKRASAEGNAITQHMAARGFSKTQLANKRGTAKAHEAAAEEHRSAATTALSQGRSHQSQSHQAAAKEHARVAASLKKG